MKSESIKVGECSNQATDGIHCDTCAGLSVARINKLRELEAENARLRAMVKSHGLPDHCSCRACHDARYP